MFFGNEGVEERNHTHGKMKYVPLQVREACRCPHRWESKCGDEGHITVISELDRGIVRKVILKGNQWHMKCREWKKKFCCKRKLKCPF